MKKFNIILGIIIFLSFVFLDMRDELTIKALWSCIGAAVLRHKIL